MALFGQSRTGGIIDAIRCDEPSYLIWKWHPKGSITGKNNRENSIRWGSSLRVKDGEAAVFVYRQKDDVDRDYDVYQDYLVGPYDGILKTENLPIIANIVGLAYGGGTPFPAEVYFINLAQLIQVRFGVPFFDVYDPRFPDFGVPVAVRGTMSFHIENAWQFIQLHRLQDFRLEDFQKQIRDTVCRYTKDIVANAPTAYNIPVVQLETKTALINKAVEHDLGKRLEESFGITLSGIDIGAIDIDKSSEAYAQLMEITKKVTAETIRAQTEVNIRQMQDRQRIEAENYQETLRIQRDESQYAQRKQTQTTHFGAYQTEVQSQIGIAGAEALGKIGENGGGAVSIEGTKFNSASIMAGMTVGGAVGQNLAGTINQVMRGTQMVSDAVPPPIPSAAYYVVIDGQATGPFDPVTLAKMAASGQLTGKSLVWKKGMNQWEKAETLDDLRTLFSEMPPIPKTEP